MNFTQGEILFYGGIIGMAIVAIVTVIVVIVFMGSRKRLNQKLNEDYGENVK